MHWYVIQVISGHEKKIKKALDESIAKGALSGFVSEILIPTEHVSEVKRGQQKILEKKVWPGYILLQMTLTDESWAAVKAIPGVLDFLGGQRPAPLSDSEVKAMMSQIEDGKKGVVQKHKVDVGDKVKITDGVFVNFVGTVLEVHHDKGRLSVMVSIFGRDTRVDDLEFWQVEQAAADAS